MAVTENSYTGNGSTTNYSFTFPYLKSTDVQVQVDAAVTTAWQFANATTVQFNTAPANGAKIKILRDTNVDSLAATFYAGSSIKSEDLNDNYTQNLYKTQEVGARYFSNTGGTMTGDLTLAEDVEIIFEGATDDAHETKLTVADPTADRTITLPNVTGTVVTTGDTGTVATSMIAADAINSSKIADDSIDSEHIGNGAINSSAMLADNVVITAKIADSNVTTAKIAADAVTSAKIADAQVGTEHLATNAVTTVKITDSNVTTAKIADSNITTAKIADSNVTTAKIAADAVTGAKIADDTLNSEHYAAGSIDTEHIADANVTTAKIADSNVTTAKINDNAVTTAKIANDAVTNSQIADNAINNENISNNAVVTAKIADANVTTAKIANGAVTNAKIANASIDAFKLAANAVDADTLQSSSVTTAKIADDAVTIAKIADSELSTLAGMQSGTASKLADSTALTADIADLNQIDGLTKQTTISDSDASFPTSGAVVDYVAAQIAPLGGLEVVATEVAFPNTQPSAGVVISISDAGGVAFNGSGTSTTGRTVGGSTVTINNAPSSLNNETLVAGVGLMVSSTGSSQTYNYHKILGKEDDIKQLSDDINDFNARYRVGSSNPTSALDAGDLFFNTSTSKLLVYNSTNSAWEEAQSIGNFFISTFSESFDGSRTAFTVSNAPANAQQLIISINGVIQKPNAGTGQPSEGFTLSGSTVTFSAAPPSGSIYFATVLGSTVNIGTPSNNTVSTAILQNSSVTTAKIADSAITADKLNNNSIITAKINDSSITTAKIADDAITGAKIATNLDLPDNNKIRFGTGNDLQIYHDSTNSSIDNDTGSLILRSDQYRFRDKDDGDTFANFIHDGAVELYYDNSKKFETTSTGISITGTHTATNYGSINLSASTSEVRWPQDGSASNSRNFNIIGEQGSYGVLDVKYSNARDENPNEKSARFIANGGVELYHDNVKKFETTSSGTLMPDDAKAIFGAGEDLQISHTSSDSDSRIMHQNENGHLRLLSGVNGNGGFKINNRTDNEAYIHGNSDGTVELYYDNNKRLETQASGAACIGTLNTKALLVHDDGSGSPLVQIKADDHAPWALNIGNDSYSTEAHVGLQIYQQNTGDLIWHNRGKATEYTSLIWQQSNSSTSQTVMRANEDREMVLYRQGTEKLRTKGHGITVTGYIEESAKPIFRAYKTNTQSFSSSTNTKVTFNQESFDVGNNYDTSTSRFTAPCNGYYQFDVNIRFTMTNFGRCDALLAKNGGFDNYFPSGGQNQTGNNDGGIQIHGVMYLAANDYVEVYANQNGGNTESFGTASNISSTGGITNWSGFLITAT